MVCAIRCEVDVVGQRHRAGVHAQDLLAALAVRRLHGHAAVEAAGPQQRRVEHVGPVGRGQHDHADRRVEAVHLGEDLVERLLALVVAAAEPAAAAAGAADRVELVDEDDRRGGLLGLLEQVAHARGADADDHLDELRGGRREERHAGLARDRAGQQRLAGARRAGQQHAARDARARAGGTSRGCGGSRRSRPARSLASSMPGHVVEGRPSALGLDALRARAPELADHAAARAAAGRAAEQEHEQADEQDRRAEREQDRLEQRAARWATRR